MDRALSADPRAEIRAMQELFGRIEREAAALKTGGALERGIYAARVAGLAVELLGLLVAHVAELDDDVGYAYDWLRGLDPSGAGLPPIAGAMEAAK